MLEARWLELTRIVLPGLAAERRWPVRNDHCFQRILLDSICGGVWYDHVQKRPAYKHLPVERLGAAVALAETLQAGTADVQALNKQSLVWRGKV